CGVGRSARRLAVARGEHEQDHKPAHADERISTSGIHRAGFAWPALTRDEPAPAALTPVRQHTNLTAAHRSPRATMRGVTETVRAPAVAGTFYPASAA